MNETPDKAPHSDYSQGVQNRKVFTTNHYIMGLPSKVALLGAATVVGTFFIGTWYFALLVALIYFPPMFAIHKDDPRALDVWKTTLTDRTAGWEAGHVRRRLFIVLSD
jgi:hypothetical protein